MESTALHLGYYSAIEGFPPESCPFPIDTVKAHDWIIGWHRGLAAVRWMAASMSEDRHE